MFNWANAAPYRRPNDQAKLPKSAAEVDPVHAREVHHHILDLCAPENAGIKSESVRMRCTLCDSDVVGPLFSCINCDGWHCCIKCEENLSDLHPAEHIFNIHFEDVGKQRGSDASADAAAGAAGAGGGAGGGSAAAAAGGAAATDHLNAGQAVAAAAGGMFSNLLGKLSSAIPPGVKDIASSAWQVYAGGGVATENVQWSVKLKKNVNYDQGTTELLEASDIDDSSTSFFCFYSRALMGCTNPLSRGVVAPHHHPLESVASYFCHGMLTCGCTF